jgi:hypothetical protein
MTLRVTGPEGLLCATFICNTEKAACAGFGGIPGREASEELSSLAHENEVSGILGHALSNLKVTENVPKAWLEHHDETLRRVRAYLNELDHMAGLFSREGMPIVALKNAGIARGIYPCPGCCPMGDLDVLVEKRHFRRAHDMLLDEGYHFEFRNTLGEEELAAAEDGGGAEYWKILPNGEKLWFELQWRPVAGRWIRPDQEPRAEELMARSIPIPGTAVRLLAPEDNLLQVALHTAKHTYARAPGFRLHLDVERIVRAYPSLDWGIFVQRVKALQVKTAVYFSLLIPHDLFGAPIPAQVLLALRPPAWKERLIIRWLNRVGLFNPHERKFSKPGYVLFNALLYDDLRGLLRGIFPNTFWMRERYGFRSNLLLPYYHARRLFDLALRRTNT